MQHVQKSIRVLDDTGNLGCLKGFIFGLSRRRLSLNSLQSVVLSLVHEQTMPSGLRALQEHMKSGGSWDRTLPEPSAAMMSTHLVACLRRVLADTRSHKTKDFIGMLLRASRKEATVRSKLL